MKHLKYLLSFFILVSALVFADPFTIKTQVQVSLTTTSTQVLPANATRTYILIQNAGTSAVILKFNTTITASEGIEIPVGGSYSPRLVPKQAVWMKSTSGTNTINIIEGY